MKGHPKMGSVTSRPKIATTTAATVATTVTPTTTIDTTTSTEATPEEIAKTRVENILRRSRSALGTVYTSFRGILSGNGTTPQRKSLLGE
jgi:hypothetical protein